MPKYFTKGLMTTALISTAFLSQSNLQASKPELFDHLPQNTLLIAHSENAKKEYDLYKDTQLFKELSQIEYIAIIDQLNKLEGGEAIDKTELKKVFNEKNKERLLALLDSSISFAILQPEAMPADSTMSFDELASYLLSNSVLQIEPEDEDAINDIIEELIPLAKKDYIKSKSNGFVVNQFKISPKSSLYILEKSGIFTFTMNLKQTIKLLDSEPDKNMNNLDAIDPLYEESHDSIAYANINELYKLILTSINNYPDAKATLSTISYITDYLMWGDINLDDKSESSTAITRLNKNIRVFSRIRGLTGFLTPYSQARIRHKPLRYLFRFSWTFSCFPCGRPSFIVFSE